MGSLEKKSFATPEAHAAFVALGGADEVALAGGVVRRLRYEPGWRWSEQVGPLVGSRVCHARHVGVVLAGRQVVETTSGERIELAPGDVFCIPPGHDGWTVGDVACVVLDFSGIGPDATGPWPEGTGQLPWVRTGDGGGAAAAD